VRIIGNNKSNKIRSVFSVFFMLVMVFMIINTILFSHSHQLPDGSIVIHAHFYKLNGDKSIPVEHQHDTNTLIYLQNIYLLFFVQVFAFVVAPLLIVQKLVLLPNTKSSHEYFKPTNTRSPPHITY
jgi:hypothetical protein